MVLSLQRWLSTSSRSCLCGLIEIVVDGRLGSIRRGGPASRSASRTERPPTRDGPARARASSDQIGPTGEASLSPDRATGSGLQYAPGAPTSVVLASAGPRGGASRP